MEPKSMTYVLVVRCTRPEIGIIAEYIASSPFPAINKDGSLELLDCDPTIWDVDYCIHRIALGKDGSVVCETSVLVDSPVVEKSGFIVRKLSGEMVGPSETRFGKFSN